MPLSNSSSALSFFFSTLAEIYILASYSKNRGKLTVSMVSKSGVGVTTAAMIRIITVAYLREDRMNLGVITPNLDSM